MSPFEKNELKPFSQKEKKQDSLPTPTPWRSVLRTNFTDSKLLADFLNLSKEDRKQLLKNSPFTLNLPLRLAKKIQKGTLKDPILNQFVPLIQENNVQEGFKEDPLDELSVRKEAKLLHKYEGRALIISTSACAMHCRYCFRRHFPYSIEKKGFKEELLQIQNTPSLEEVILSGGDPLSLPDSTLGELISALSSISHLKRIRIHTRFPIGIPERIDASFLDILKNSSKQWWFVFHINHAKELDDEVIKAINQLRPLGPLLCQTVLLKGVNDSFEALHTLFSNLINFGIHPYYLHQLDPVQGGAHFEVPEYQGLQLIQQLRKTLPGYAIPQYVKEISQMPSKTPLFKN